MRDEGVIKFSMNFSRSQWKAPLGLDSLIEARNTLFEAGLIGEYPDGIGYGNLSARTKANGFYITGSQTGSYPKITDNHISLVTEYDIMKNTLSCTGPIKASSESLTHAMIYEMDDTAQSVIHIHDRNLWKSAINKLPTTDPQIPYGTPQMALEIRRLIDNDTLSTTKVLVMAGHDEGVLSFGSSVEEAMSRLSASYRLLVLEFC